MASAWCAHCDSWRGNGFACTEKDPSTGQFLTLAALLGRPRNCRRPPPTEKQDAASCSRRCIAYHVCSSVSREVNKQRSHHLLWKTFFQDHTRWWDSWHRKRNPRSSDFWHKESRGAVRLPKCYKPACWVNAEVATLDARPDHDAPPVGLLSYHSEQLVGPGSGKRFTPKLVKKLCQQGQVKGAVEVLEFLVGSDPGIDKYLLYSVLKECLAKRDLALGGRVHVLAVKAGFGTDTFLCNHFIRMYAAHGKLQDAMDVFTRVTLPDAFMWSSIISAYAKQGQAERAIELYRHMRATRTKPDNYVFVAALQACATAGDLHSGTQMHDDVLTCGLGHDVFICNCLVEMYVKCGSLEDARRVFDGLEKKNVVTWTVMIAGYAKAEGMGQDALSLYSVMHNEGSVVPDRVTFVCLLQACANVGVSALEKGTQLHSQIKERGLESDMDVGSSLVNMYAKCGSLADARSVFDGLREKNVVTWSAMISGYAKMEGMGQEALNLHSAMRNEGTALPDRVTFLCLLQACTNVGVSALEKGKQLHSEVEKCGLQSDRVVGCSLVNMYTKCGSLTDARIVFDGLHEKNVVAWTTMIAGYAKVQGMGQEALSLYSAMLNESTVSPNAVTFVCLLQACANVGVSALETGKQFHSQIKERRLEFDMAVGGSLVNMYAKCGSLNDARVVFDKLGERNVVTWTAMIAGYAKVEGMSHEALSLYSAMHEEGMAIPDGVTYVSLLQACASVGALEQGRQLHSEIRERGFESDALIGTALVKMYAQCGRLKISREVFDELPVKTIETWTALMKGYAEHGDGSMAIQCFEELLEQQIQPDEVTYICLLAACSHAGLVDQGQQYFESMEKLHGVKPDDRHYTCMVDLFGRSGHLDKAEQMLRASNHPGSVPSWTALLSACKSYGDPDLGRRCFDHLVNLQPTVATAYVLLGNIYANAGRWDEVERIETQRKAAGAGKKAAKAYIELKKKVHEFTVGEERSDVAATLKKLIARANEGGHVPQTQLVLRAVSEEEKEDALCGHAEKLALAYGLLNTPAGSPLVVTKNLRMCNDCHSSTKIMSRVEKREIVVRDGHKVHCFQGGVCSCQDRP